MDEALLAHLECKAQQLYEEVMDDTCDPDVIIGSYKKES